MKKNITAKAQTYRLPTATTPENLEMWLMHNGGTILTFGDRTLVAGYYYNPNGKNYYAAAYRFASANHTCEGKIELVSVSEETFEDNGHAIAWAMAN